MKHKTENLIRDSRFMIHDRRGVILVELMLALGILTILGGLIAATFYAGQQSGQTATQRTQAAQLAQEAMDAAKAVAEEDYYSFYNRSKGSGNPYHPEISGGKWVFATDTEAIVLDSQTFTRKIVIDNVSRSGSDIQATYESANDDPSTQKITVTVSRARQADVVITDYVTRWRNTVPAQTNWAGGSGITDPVTTFATGYDSDDGNIEAVATPGSILLKLQ